eukprot:m.91353 g.91353  ORF g.91353 m.91353 type:complete len:169 (-) comp18215_c0_seq2:982-1488(-)
MGFNSVIEAQLDGQPVQLTISGGSGNRVSISITAEEGRVVAQSDSGWSFSTLSDNQLQITMGERCLGLSFVQHQDALFAEQQLRLAASSVFDRTREQASVAEYFKFYAILSQQQNMLTVNAWICHRHARRPPPSPHSSSLLHAGLCTNRHVPASDDDELGGLSWQGGV